MARPLARLAGKSMLITGGSRGIGRAVALRSAAEGASVAINHLGDVSAAADTVSELVRVSAANSHSDARHSAIEADVADANAAQAMVASIVSACGRIDILINNAGVQPQTTPGSVFDAPSFDRVIAVNLMAVANLCAAAIAQFEQRPGGGVIINTTSVHEIIPKPGYAAYAVSKSGLGMLTRTLALEYASRGIRVNAVGPGAVTTDMNAAWINDPIKRGQVEHHIPMGRAAAPDDIAGVYIFLASDDAVYVTGQTLFACGGLTLFGDFQRNWSS